MKGKLSLDEPGSDGEADPAHDSELAGIALVQKSAAELATGRGGPS